jgi:hypothetical protein
LEEKDAFFVSTHHATPFARNAVNGLVPAHLFELLDPPPPYMAIPHTHRKSLILNKPVLSDGTTNEKPNIAVTGDTRGLKGAYTSKEERTTPANVNTIKRRSRSFDVWPSDHNHPAASSYSAISNQIRQHPVATGTSSVYRAPPMDRERGKSLSNIHNMIVPSDNSQYTSGAGTKKDLPPITSQNHIQGLYQSNIEPHAAQATSITLDRSFKYHNGTSATPGNQAFLPNAESAKYVTASLPRRLDNRNNTKNTPLEWERQFKVGVTGDTRITTETNPSARWPAQHDHTFATKIIPPGDTLKRHFNNPLSNYKIVSTAVVGFKLQTGHINKTKFIVNVNRGSGMIHTVARSYEDFALFHTTLSTRLQRSAKPLDSKGLTDYNISQSFGELDILLPKQITNILELRKKNILESRLKEQQMDLDEYLESLSLLGHQESLESFLCPWSESEAQLFSSGPKSASAIGSSAAFWKQTYVPLTGPPKMSSPTLSNVFNKCSLDDIPERQNQRTERSPNEVPINGNSGYTTLSGVAAAAEQPISDSALNLSVKTPITKAWKPYQMHLQAGDRGTPQESTIHQRKALPEPKFGVTPEPPIVNPQLMTASRDIMKLGSAKSPMVPTENMGILPRSRNLNGSQAESTKSSTLGRLPKHEDEQGPSQTPVVFRSLQRPALNAFSQSMKDDAAIAISRRTSSLGWGTLRREKLLTNLGSDSLAIPE